MEAELDIDKLQDEIEELKQLLDESNSAREQSAMQAEQLAVAAVEDKAELEHLHKKLKSFREDASRFSREDDRRIRHLQREKQDADKKNARLKSEVAELRSVIEQYVGQIKSGLEGGAASALVTELDMVRKQAETDVNRMREQLRAREQNDSAGLTELDALRREIGSLQQSDEANQKSLAEAISEQQHLREEIEKQYIDIQQLQRALDSAREEIKNSESRRRDQLEISKQLEASLDAAREELERLRKDEDSAATDSIVDNVANRLPPSLQRHKFTAALFGAVAAFIVAEGISIVSGRGELITGLVGENQQETAFEFPRLEKTNPTQPKLGSDREPEPVIISRVVDLTAEKSQTEKSLPKFDQGLATGTTIRDPLKLGGNGPDMAYIRGGVFNMGQRHDQLARDERPLHPVKLKNFAIGKNEVTFNEYQLFVRATGRNMPSDQGWGEGTRPIINISWIDAAAYARWLTGQTGITYRLPTEAEWEFAASGGMDSFYWWGYELGENRASCFDCGSRWDGKSTAPVGSFPANPFSLNDTAGNVMEWVADCYHVTYRGAPRDGSAWVEKDCSQFVARGGAFNKPGDSLHTTRRFNFQLDTRLPTLGFRVVREVD